MPEGSAAMTFALSRRARIIAICAAGAFGLTLLILAAFPVGWLKAGIEDRLSRQIGKQVSIGAIERETAVSFTPVIRLTDIAIPQPDWAGTGKLATARRMRVKIDTLGMLAGRANPRLLEATGATLSLVRDAGGRVNWRG